MRLKSLLFANFVLILTACSSAPQSYLPEGEKPIVNIDARVAPLVQVDASPEKLDVTNLSEQALNVSYKLFWYDAEGVTQGSIEKTPWQPLWLEPKAKQNIALNKPTVESAKYRFYLRGAR